MMRSPTLRERLARLVLALAAACLMVELLAGPVYRLQWASLKVALTTLRWSATLAAAVFVVALLLALFAGRRLSPPARRQCLAAALLALVAFAPPVYLWTQVNQLPHIHDISTDTEDPPVFVAIAPLRQSAPNGLDYSAAVAAQQKQGYADIAPLTLAVPAPQAFERAKVAAHDMGWELVAAEPGELRLEATATTLLFGFKDDVVVRVRPQGQGSRVDVRSVSRVGGSDFGTNAKRIRAFLAKLQ
jgi:uncharacterized protein (DUF1499 family)